MNLFTDICFISIILPMYCESVHFSKCEELGMRKNELLYASRYNKKVLGPEAVKNLMVLEMTHRNQSMKYLCYKSQRKNHSESTDDDAVLNNPHLPVTDLFVQTPKKKSLHSYCRVFFSYLGNDPEKEIVAYGVLEVNKVLKYQFIAAKKEEYPVTTVLRCTLSTSGGVEYFIDAFREGCVLRVKPTAGKYKYFSIVEKHCDKNMENISPEHDSAREISHSNEFQHSESKKRKYLNVIEEFPNIAIRQEPIFKEEPVDEDHSIPGKQSDSIIIYKRKIKKDNREGNVKKKMGENIREESTIHKFNN